MDYKSKSKQRQIIAVVVLASIVTGFGMLIGFSNLLKSILFILPFFLLLPVGGYYIIMNFDGRKQFLLFAFWLGFIGFITSLIGMLIDSSAFPLDWGYILTVAGVVWLIIFVFVAFMTPVYSAIYQFWRNG